MKDLDILSQSPNNFIFRKDSNKTFIGGLLSCFYFVSALLIFDYYLVRYCSSDTYEITSYISRKRVLSEKNLKKFKESEKYNPTLQMKFSFTERNENPLSDRFAIYDGLNQRFIEREEIIERRVNETNIYVLYKCLNGKNLCDIEENDRMAYYNLIFNYQGFHVEPQYNKVSIEKFDKNIFNTVYLNFNPDIKLETRFEWIIIRCEDEKGLLHEFDTDEEPEIIKENDIYIGGKFKIYDSIIKSKNTVYSEIKNYRYVFQFETINPNNYLYEDYKRRVTSFLDYCADIFSLWISLYNLLSFLFSKLYSKSFDKYKIVESILLKQKEKLDKNKKQKTSINDLDDSLDDNLLENRFNHENIDNITLNDDINIKIDD